MSLEAKIDALIVALEANTAARNAEKAAGTTGGKTGTAGKTDAKAGAKPKNTVEQMKTAVMSVKETIDPATAKALIEEFAGAGKKLADLAAMPGKFDAVVAKATELLDAAAAGGDDDNGDDDDDI